MEVGEVGTLQPLRVNRWSATGLFTIGINTSHYKQNATHDEDEKGIRMHTNWVGVLAFQSVYVEAFTSAVEDGAQLRSFRAVCMKTFILACNVSKYSKS